MTIALRTDQSLIAEWIRHRSRVLDLGCGDGALLHYLQQHHEVTGYGLEIDPRNIVKCITRGINVIHTDLDAGLPDDLDSEPFDYVIMTQTLQAVRHPDRLLGAMARIGREGIVTFPNMAHWKCRLQFALGHMPISRTLPYDWYDTPNIHLCSLTDFESLCDKLGIEILERATVDHAHRKSLGMHLFPNFLGQIAVYRFQRRSNHTSATVDPAD